MWGAGERGYAGTTSTVSRLHRRAAEQMDPPDPQTSPSNRKLIGKGKSPFPSFSANSPDKDLIEPTRLPAWREILKRDFASFCACLRWESFFRICYIFAEKSTSGSKGLSYVKDVSNLFLSLKVSFSWKLLMYGTLKVFFHPSLPITCRTVWYVWKWFSRSDLLL